VYRDQPQQKQELSMKPKGSSGGYSTASNAYRSNIGPGKWKEFSNNQCFIESIKHTNQGA
jgi:hypothetical protein